MPLGKFQKGLRKCEGVSLERKSRLWVVWWPYPGVEKVRRCAASSYEDAPAAMSFLNLVTATSVFSW
jgi:hypothetical protein